MHVTDWSASSDLFVSSTPGGARLLSRGAAYRSVFCCSDFSSQRRRRAAYRRGKRLPLAIAVSSACIPVDAAAVDAASVYEILPNTLTLPLLIRLGTQRRELSDGSAASRYPALFDCLFIRERLSRPRGDVRARLSASVCVCPAAYVRLGAAVVFCVAG